MFCSAWLYPEVCGRVRCSSRSLVFCRYQSTVPVMRLSSMPNSTPRSAWAVFSHLRFGLAGLFALGAYPGAVVEPKLYGVRKSAPWVWYAPMDETQGALLRTPYN